MAKSDKSPGNPGKSPEKSSAIPTFAAVALDRFLADRPARRYLEAYWDGPCQTYYVVTHCPKVGRRRGFYSRDGHTWEADRVGGLGTVAARKPARMVRLIGGILAGRVV